MSKLPEEKRAHQREPKNTMKRYILILLSLLMTVNAQAAIDLSSNPFAPNVIYINCTTVPWTATDDVIYQVWKIVADLYGIFNVNVTTVFPGYRPNVAQVVMGGTSPIPGAAGQSALGNWKLGTQYDQFATPFAARVYTDSLGNIPWECGGAAAHELGHQFGLNHMETGVMVANLDPNMFYWSEGTDSVGVTLNQTVFLGGQMGLAPVPEPSLWAILPLLMFTRPRRRRQSR